MLACWVHDACLPDRLMTPACLVNGSGLVCECCWPGVWMVLAWWVDVPGLVGGCCWPGGWMLLAWWVDDDEDAREWNHAGRLGE